MTSYIHNVKNLTTKAPGNSLQALFATFLTTLPQMIADERDLDGFSGQDPAVDAWIKAADASLEMSKAACAAVLAAPATGVADRAMQRVARMFQTVMYSADPHEVARLRAHARMRRWAWLVPDDVAGHRRYNGMIVEALDALETWIALDDIFDARAMDWADRSPDHDGECDVGPTA